MIRFWKLLTGWPPSAGRGNPEDLLHSIEGMRAILDRERMRSDRGNSSFALVTFAFSPPRDQADLRRFAPILCERIRATDVAGLLGPRHVGVVLPETPAEGAWKLAEDIFDLLPAPMRQCEVYVYPSHHELPSPLSDGEAAEGPESPPGSTDGRVVRPADAGLEADH